MKKIIKCEDIEFQIYIEDTDFQGVVYHSNYLKYFERSRSEFLSYANISQNKLREKNLAFIVKSIKINYLKAAELGNQIVVQSNVEKKSDARMIFYQKVVDTENIKIIKENIVDIDFNSDQSTISLESKKNYKQFIDSSKLKTTPYCFDSISFILSLILFLTFLLLFIISFISIFSFL